MSNNVKSDHFIASVGEVFKKLLLATNHAHMADGGAMFCVQQKVTTRVFMTSNFRKFTESVFHKDALRVVDIITAQNGKVNMHTITNQFTLQTIFDIGCGISLEEFDTGLGLKFVNTMDFASTNTLIRLLLKPYFEYLWWCMPSEYHIRRESKVMLNLVDGILTNV